MIYVVDMAGVTVDAEGGRLIITGGDTRRATVPLARLERLVVSQQAQLTGRALARLGACGIGVLLPQGRFARPPVHMLEARGDAALRMVQAQLATDDIRRCTLAADIVRKRLLGAATVLQQQPRSLDIRRALARLQDAHQNLCQGGVGQPLPLNSLRGIEGAAMAAWFAGYCTLFHKPLGFTGRNRRPPRDPVNALLSLGYTMAHQEALAACALQGLDSASPLYHEFLPGRASLACDIVETARYHVDTWVVRLFREGHIGSADFQTDPSRACLLLKPARQAVYRDYADHTHKAVQAATRQTAAWLVTELTGKLPPEVKHHAPA